MSRCVIFTFIDIDCFGRLIFSVLAQQRNDEEVSEFEKQKRIEENYRFKWSKTKEKKETQTAAIDD